MTLHEQNSVCWPPVGPKDNKYTYVHFGPADCVEGIAEETHQKIEATQFFALCINNMQLIARQPGHCIAL